jgi:SagB-type dehydrogenase family enzyme
MRGTVTPRRSDAWRAPLIALLAAYLAACQEKDIGVTITTESTTSEVIQLPKPRVKGAVSLEEALNQRRSVREFADASLSIEEISQLLWAAQGITDTEGRRTAPSAGALYPLELYVLMSEGFFHYDPEEHSLHRLSREDLRRAVYAAALEQDSVLQAPVTLVFTAVYRRTEQRYGSQRTPRYVHMEVGHAAQNVLLQAVALGLGGVPIGAFHDARVQQVLALPEDHAPLYLIPVGRPR